MELIANLLADRGGLLVCQDVFVVKKLFSKLAGLPERYWGRFDVSELENQARAFEGFTEKSFDKFIRFLYGNNLWAIARAHEMMKWVDSGEFTRLMVRKGKKGTPYLQSSA